jgi:hypothetical protein
MNISPSKGVGKAMNLPDALQAEMTRVRDRVLPFYTHEVNGQFAATIMRRDLDIAAKALAEQDIKLQIKMLAELKEWTI